MSRNLSHSERPGSGNTGELFAPGYLCMQTARDRIEKAFGNTPDARISVNPLQRLDNQVALILDTKQLQNEDGYIDGDKLLKQLKKAAKVIYGCLNSSEFSSYFANAKVSDPRAVALGIYRKALEDIVAGFDIDTDFLGWLDIDAESSTAASTPKLQAVRAPYPEGLPISRTTQPLDTSVFAREASDRVIASIPRDSLAPTDVSKFQAALDEEDTIVDNGSASVDGSSEGTYELMPAVVSYFEALVNQYFVNEQSLSRTDMFLRSLMLSRNKRAKLEEHSSLTASRLVRSVERQVMSEKPGSFPAPVVTIMKQGAIGGVEGEVTKMFLQKLLAYNKDAEERQKLAASAHRASSGHSYSPMVESRIPELHLVDYQEGMRPAIDCGPNGLREVEVAPEDLVVVTEVNRYAERGYTPVAAMTPPAEDAVVETAESELSDDELATILNDAGISTSPEGEVGMVELDASELEGIEGVDLEEVTKVYDLGRPYKDQTLEVPSIMIDPSVIDDKADTPVMAEKKVSPQDEAQAAKLMRLGEDDLEEVTVEMAPVVSPTAPTIPPAARPQPETQPVVELSIEQNISEKEPEKKPTLLERIKQSKAFRVAVHTVAAAATILSTGTVPGVGTGQLNYGERQPDTMEESPESTPIAKNAEQQMEDDIVFEEGPQYEINERSLENSKLLAKTIHEGGFKRSPSYNGDFSELNFRLTDNATPEQMVKIKEIYQRYQTGDYKRMTDPNGTSAPEARAFYQEAVNGFAEVGVGGFQRDGVWNINRKGGETGSFVKITDASGNYIPFVKEVLIARGVLVEKGADTTPAPNQNVDQPVNVPINFELTPDAPYAPAAPGEIIHTMNLRTNDVLNDEFIELDESDIISDEPEITVGETELSASELAELEAIEVDAGWDDIVVEEKDTLLKGYCQSTDSVDTEWV